MTIIDTTHFRSVIKLFPELTATQFETVALHSIGISLKEIATLRQVSSTSVKRSLESARENLGLTSISCLRSVFQIRLLLCYCHQGCSNQQATQDLIEQHSPPQG